MDTQGAHTQEGRVMHVINFSYFQSFSVYLVLHALRSAVTTQKLLPKQPPNVRAHSAPLSVLFVVVLCGSVESELLTELFKLFFHRCFYDFLGQLPFEWENTKRYPSNTLQPALNTLSEAVHGTLIETQVQTLPCGLYIKYRSRMNSDQQEC